MNYEAHKDLIIQLEFSNLDLSTFQPLAPSRMQGNRGRKQVQRLQDIQQIQGHLEAEKSLSFTCSAQLSPWSLAESLSQAYVVRSGSVFTKLQPEIAEASTHVSSLPYTQNSNTCIQFFFTTFNLLNVTFYI